MKKNLRQLLILTLFMLCSTAFGESIYTKENVEKLADKAAASPILGERMDWGLGFLEQLRSNEQADIVFLGDSLLERFNSKGKNAWSEHLADLGILNYALEREVLNSLLFRLEKNILYKAKPKIVVLSCGVESLVNLVRFSPEQTMISYKTIVDNIHAMLPNCKIVVLSTPRITPCYRRKDGQLQPNEKYTQETEDKRKAINALLKEYCKTHKNLGFVDINSLFANADGSVNESLLAKDFKLQDRGLRIGEKGYDALGAVLKKVLKRQLSKQNLQNNYSQKYKNYEHKPEQIYKDFSENSRLSRYYGVYGHWASTQWLDTHVKYNARTRNEYADADVVLIGDSITASWNYHNRKGFLEQGLPGKKILNLGIGGDTTYNILWRLENGHLHKDFKPKLFVILAGVNNVQAYTSWMKPQYVATAVKNIVDTLRRSNPEAKVLLLGLTPFGREKDEKRREICRNINAILQTYEDKKMIHYIDIKDALLDEKGFLTPEMSGDTLHFTVEGYKRMANVLVPKMKELLE